MTKKQAENYFRLKLNLMGIGFDYQEIDALIKIEHTLHRWSELECGNDRGCIEREATTGKPFLRQGYGEKYQCFPVADRENGALKRLAKIMLTKPGLIAYHQRDCRGCTLYIVKKSDISKGEYVDSVYTRGIAVCY